MAVPLLHPALLLNHGLLQGVGRRPVAETAAAARALLATRAQAVAFWPRASFFVHERLWEVPADEAGTTFSQWAGRNARHPELRDVIGVLLALCNQGPYLDALPVDDGAAPQSIAPWPVGASPSLVEVVQRGLHHRLAHPDARAWLLSFGAARAVLGAPSYTGMRGTHRAELANLRDEDEGLAAMRDAAAEGLRDRRDLLERVQQATTRVRLLDDVIVSIENAHIPVPLHTLYAALVGLEAFASALEDDADPAVAYHRATGVQASDESRSVKQRPNLRRLRERRLPGDTKSTFFGWHAKFAGGMRMHFAWRSEMLEGKERMVVYVGYIGRHLPGARG